MPQQTEQPQVIQDEDEQLQILTRTIQRLKDKQTHYRQESRCEVEHPEEKEKELQLQDILSNDWLSKK